MAGKVGTAFRYFFVARTGSGAARTGLVTANFTITLRNPADSATLAAPTVTEVGLGLYFFDIAAAFTTTNGAGQYGLAISVILAPLDTGGDIIEFFAADIDDAAQPGDAMDLVTDAVDANSVATSGADEIRDSILSDSTPFAGANVDVAISTRATQAQILSDATPFPGANIDATISSRSDFDETTDPVELLDSGGAAGTSAAELVADIDAALIASHGAGSWLTSTLTSGAIATAVWSEVLPGAFGPGTAGLILGTNLDVVLSTRAAPGDAMALTVAERTATATEVDVVLSAAHGAGSWVGAGLTAAQDTAVIETWQQLGNDVLNKVGHKDATDATPGYIRVPVDGSLIDITVTKTGADTVELERQP